MHCLSNRNCRGRHRISPRCSTVPLDWFPYWIRECSLPNEGQTNPGNGGGQIEYKKALCSILKTFRQAAEGFLFIVQYLNGGAFDSPFSEKGAFCISGFVILKKRSQIFDYLTFCFIFSRFLLIYTKTPHESAAFLQCIFFINTFCLVLIKKMQTIVMHQKPTRNPAQRVRVGKDEQRSGADFAPTCLVVPKKIHT